jgi:2-methylcitrate dehydratase PrpD
MDADVAITKNAINLKYEDLPSDVVEMTKRQILDTLGVIAGASTLGQGSQEIVKLVKESGARGKSTIIGYGGRVPSWMAGFANGSMAHELDYDDFQDEAIVHPGICSIPAAFAVAEEVGNVSGKEFIVAVAMAVDLICRMGNAIRRSADAAQLGWFNPPLLGYFSATAAAGKILRLTEDQMLDSFGHTLQQAAGSAQMSYGQGSIFRGIRDGFSNKAGILSALMAKRGLPGTRESLEGKAGFYNLYFRGVYERSCLTDDLGKRFENTKVGFKPWPACRATHSAIDGTLGILSRQPIAPEDIAEIRVLAGDTMNSQDETTEERLKPKTIIDAKISTPFTLGIAATKRNVVMKDFTPYGLKDPAVLQMARKVVMKSDTRLKGTRSTTVEIKSKNGKLLSKRVDFAYGDPRKPIAKDDLLNKFRDCVTYSVKPPSSDETERIIEMVDELEKIKDVSRIVRLLD